MLQKQKSILKSILTTVAACLCAFILMQQPSVVDAQEGALPTQETGDPTDLLADSFVAPVVVDGETLFFVRGFSALPAQERAAKIEQRILEIAALPEFVELEFLVRENEFGLAVLANGRLVTVTTPADAEYEQVGLDVLAELHAEEIRQAVSRYRSGRSNEARVESALVAVAWTFPFFC